MENFNFNKNPEKKTKKHVFSNLTKAVLISAGLISASSMFASNTEQTTKSKEKAKTEILNEMKNFYQKEASLNESSLDYLKFQNLSNEQLEEIKKEIKNNEIKHQEIATNPEIYYEKIINAVEEYKQNLIKHFSSNEFLDKLKRNLTEEQAKDKQKEIINNLNTVHLVIASPDSIREVTGSIAAGACYSLSEHRILIPFSEINWEDITHELIHAAYKATKELTPKDERILIHNFTKDRNMNKNRNKYQKDPAERIVRKTLLDLDMEQWGIKKYNEKFTHEHYLKLLELKKENKLDKATLDLLNTITEKQLEKIMNTIAFNEAVKNITDRKIIDDKIV